jgi:adenylate cyclase
MFVSEDPAAACRIALELVRGFETGPLPPVRVGLAAGEVVAVLGDVYGPDVNLASRLVDIADQSTVVVSESVRAGAAGAPDLEFDALPPVVVKGFADPVVAYRLVAR